MINRYNKGTVHISVWIGPVQQVEIFTERGKSYVARETEAREFAAWLRDNLVIPILGGHLVVERGSGGGGKTEQKHQEGVK